MKTKQLRTTTLPRINSFADAQAFAEKYEHLAEFANNTDVWTGVDRGHVHVRLHATNIIVFMPNGIRLDSGGWRSTTTKQRMNAMLPWGVRVFQTKGDWYVFTRQSDGTDDTAAFEDGMIVTYAGWGA